MDAITKQKKTLSLILPEFERKLTTETQSSNSKIKSGLSREFSESKVLISKMSFMDFLDPDDLELHNTYVNVHNSWMNGVKESFRSNQLLQQQNEELANTIRVKDALFLAFLASVDPLIKLLVEKLGNLTLFPEGAPAGTGEISGVTGVSYDPGQPGLDITFADNQNRALYPGVVVKIGHQYSPNATGGDGRQGAGYGNYIVIRSMNPITRGEMDVLYAHFPDGELNKFKVGDNIGRGQFLGRMATAEEFANPRTRPRVGSGTGPHMSIDFYQPVDGSMIPASEIERVRKYTDEQLRSGGFEKMRRQENPTPRDVIVAVGTNDYSDPDKVRRDTLSIISQLKSKGANVIIVPPNRSAYPEAYQASVDAARSGGAKVEEGTYETRDVLHLKPTSADAIRQKYPEALVVGDSNAVRIAGNTQKPGTRFVGAHTDEINKNIAKHILGQLLDKN